MGKPALTLQHLAQVNVLCTPLDTLSFVLRACTSSALQGCKTVLACQTERRGNEVPIEAIVKLETKIFREVPIASLSQDNRHRTLDLLLAIVKVNHRLAFSRSCLYLLLTLVTEACKLE